MEQKERSTRAELKQSGREEQSKPASPGQERSEIVEQLKLLNYNLLSIGLILGGTLGIMSCTKDINSNFSSVLCSNLKNMKEVNAKMGMTGEEDDEEH